MSLDTYLIPREDETHPHPFRVVTSGLILKCCPQDVGIYIQLSAEVMWTNPDLYLAKTVAK